MSERGSEREAGGERKRRRWSQAQSSSVLRDIRAVRTERYKDERIEGTEEWSSVNACLSGAAHTQDTEAFHQAATCCIIKATRMDLFMIIHC